MDKLNPRKRPSYKSKKRIVILLFINLFLLHFQWANAQGGINLSIKNSSLQSIFVKIESVTPYRFTYRDDILPKSDMFSISVENRSIEAIMDELLASTNLTYKITGETIAIIPKTQQKLVHVTGMLSDAEGIPIIGATIIEKGTTRGTISDVNGNFALDVLPNAVLQISYLGYEMKEISATSKDGNPLMITLHEDAQALEEVVVVGYGSQLKRSITGAISSISGDAIKSPNAVSADNLLQGRIAGLVSTQNSAQPGTGMNVAIRGALSPNGSNAPLYVIDGVVINSSQYKASKPGPSAQAGFSLRDGSDRSPLATLNPNDIASIDVLKDASAAAIYGSSAANGVILITTKKGQTGQPKVSYSGSFSVQGINKYYDMLDVQQYMNYTNDIARERWIYSRRYFPYGTTEAPDSGWPVIYDEEDLAQTKTFDHIKDITRTGMIHDHNVSINAGTDKFKIYASFNYFDQKSILETTDLARYSGRINFETTFSKYLKLNVASMYTVINANNPSTGHWRGNANEANMTNAALYFSPRLPLEDEGTITPSEFALMPNPAVWRYIKDYSETKRILFAPNLEIKLYKNDLKANVQLSIDKTDDARDIFGPKKSRLPGQIQENYGGYANTYNSNYSLEEHLTYDKKFGKDHQLNAVIGTGYYNTKYNGYSFTVFNFPSDALENYNLGTSSDVESTTYGSYKMEYNKLSFFGRANYTFKDRYIFGATLRRDGSSAFAKNNKFGWFPGLSAAWIISEESFMEGITPLSYLKIRGGYGTSGNQSILTGGTYPLTTYGTVSGGWYYFGGQLNRALIQRQKGNTDLKWETDETINIGLDFSLFHDRLSGSFDWYQRTARDLLDFATLPVTDIVPRIAKNVGSTRSTGYEVALKGKIIETKDFGWDAYLNFNHNHSFWLERNPEVAIPSWVKEQDDLNPIYGWKTNGIFRSLEEVEQYTSNGQVLQPGSLPGNLKFVDINGDGKLDDEDIVKLGNREPKLFFGLGTGLRYKNFQLDIDAYGRIGQKESNNWLFRIGDERTNTSVHVHDVWTSYNPNGWYPGIATNVAANNNKTGVNDFTLKDVHFLRLKNVRFTYFLPSNLLNEKGIAQGASIFVDLQNTLLFTNYDGLDPEMERNYAAFPIPYTIVFGVNINF